MDPRRFREVYRECMRNHAAARGLYATDGCGEYMQDRTRPGSNHCAACGCHRSFHRKELLEVGGNNGGGVNGVGGGGGGGGVHGAGGGGGGDAASSGSSVMVAEAPAGARRARTRFSPQQKEMKARVGASAAPNEL